MLKNIIKELIIYEKVKFRKKIIIDVIISHELSFYKGLDFNFFELTGNEDAMKIENCRVQIS